MAGNLHHRTATLADIDVLHEELRHLDREEIIATGGDDTLRTLQVSLLFSEHPRAVFRDGELVCVYGISPKTTLSDIGIPWMLGTDRVRRNAKQVTLDTRAFMAAARERYRLLENYVDARNKPSVRWLQRVGFTLEPAAPWGKAGLPFHRFHMGA